MTNQPYRGKHTVAHMNQQQEQNQYKPTHRKPGPSQLPLPTRDPQHRGEYKGD